jgi:two-component system, OmpR family, phosphate regulon sensor histidine kinase PhoR
VSFSVRTKLFLVSIALIAVSMAAADAYLTSAIGRHLTRSIQADLLVRAHLVAREAAASPAPLARDEPSWDVLADSLGDAARVRVTLIRADGLVLGDSDVPADELKNLENHASRPEVEQALTTGEGGAERVSATMQLPMIYSAARFERAGTVAGVARVAQPLREVERAKSDMRRIIWIASALALLVALILSNSVAKRMSGAVSELTEAARRMSEGDLAVRTRMGGHDELGELGDALDRLAGSLATTLGQLRAERDLQGRILEAMQEGVVVIDRDGRIVLVNPALRSMLLVGAEAVGKLLVEAVRHAQLEDLVVEARATATSRPVEIDLPGLKPRRLLVHASPLSGDDEGLLFVFVDVTEVRRLESLRRDFVANASHELRTPIAAVRSATETLRWGALEDPGAAIRFVDIIDRNAQRLQSLVEDMLELSKLESNEFKLKRERVELGSVVPIVLALFRERAEKKGVQVVAELPREHSAVEGDPRALEHVLSNLVDNAVKYCPRGTRVLVSAALLDDERIKLVVADTGQGIAAEHLPRLFERFYRVDAGRSRDLGGTGLGLSIVKHMVEAMRGKVSVESEVGKGSTFTVALLRARLEG